MGKNKSLAVLWTISVAVLCAFSGADGATVSEALAVGVQEGVPGGVSIETVKLRAKIVALDIDARKATLLGPMGNLLTVQAQADAVNFDQLRRDQYVDAIITRTLTAFLGAKENPADDPIKTVASLAPPGAMPGGLIAENLCIKAKIWTIYLDDRTVVLQFPDASTKTFSVRDDIDMKAYTVGESMVIHVRESVALAQEK